MKEGMFVGSRPPYGYRKSPENCHVLMINRETAPIVRTIFECVYAGLNVYEITRRLNDAGILPPSRYKLERGFFTGNELVGREHWQKWTVRTILADRVYAGDLVQGKSKKMNGRQIAISQQNWIIRSNTHEAIVNREMFFEVQKILQDNASLDKSNRMEAISYTENIFKGKIFCTHCGYAMHRHRSKEVYWFNCQTRWYVPRNPAFRYP
ncbi:MAG: recombinase family protein [Oscillospiraceae bacterium]|jgi:hypothetical protein|nr:recombinase family protein [Oscillospiraceae bacterium]